MLNEILNRMRDGALATRELDLLCAGTLLERVPPPIAAGVLRWYRAGSAPLSSLALFQRKFYDGANWTYGHNALARAGVIFADAEIPTFDKRVRAIVMTDEGRRACEEVIRRAEALRSNERLVQRVA